MILVTGATGHIGNVLIRELLGRSERVRALVRPGKKSIALTDLNIETVPGDLLDISSLVQAMQGVDIVYHLAARISIQPGPDPEVERVNLEGTHNILTAAGRVGVRRLVYASSIYAMRVPSEGIVDEACPFDPQNARGAYDRSKAAASLEVRNAAGGGLEAIIACPTAVVGPYDFHASETGRAIRINMSPGIKFYVDGAYDFVDVRDAAHGFLLAGEKGRSGEVYILGGDRLTIREVAETVWDTAGCWHSSIKIPLRLAYLSASLMPLYAELSGTQPIFTAYSLDAVGSNSNISHAKAACELGYAPRRARQAIVDAVRWWQAEAVRVQERAKTAVRAAD